MSSPAKTQQNEKNIPTKEPAVMEAPVVESNLGEVVGPKGRALFLLGPNNPIRTAAWKLSKNAIFDGFILVVIFINCVFLALEQSLDGVGTWCMHAHEEA